MLLALRNRLEHVVAYWALQKLGGVAVPVNFRLAANELRYLLADSGAKVALFENSTSDPMLEAARGTPTCLVFVGDRKPTGATPSDDVLGFEGVLGDGAGGGWGGVARRSGTPSSRPQREALRLGERVTQPRDPPRPPPAPSPSCQARVISR